MIKMWNNPSQIMQSTWQPLEITIPPFVWWHASIHYSISFIIDSFFNKFWQNPKCSVLSSNLMNEENPNVKQFPFHYAYSVVLDKRTVQFTFKAKTKSIHSLLMVSVRMIKPGALPLSKPKNNKALLASVCRHPASLYW